MDRIQGSVKWDDTNSGCFAHLYEKDLGIGEVVETKQIPEGCTGQLDERAGARWLAYLNLDLTSFASGDQTRGNQYLNHDYCHVVYKQGARRLLRCVVIPYPRNPSSLTSHR